MEGRQRWGTSKEAVGMIQGREADGADRAEVVEVVKGARIPDVCEHGANGLSGERRWRSVRPGRQRRGRTLA